MSETGGSVARVRAALLQAGHPDTIQVVPETARTAAGAAEAIGCTVAQIAKSIVFRAGEDAVVVIASGTNRIDPGKVAAVVGRKLDKADAAFIRTTTGFAIGGVAPVGHLGAPIMLLDSDLFALDPVWAAAGSPSHVFRTSAEELKRMSGGQVAEVRQD